MTDTNLETQRTDLGRRGEDVAAAYLVDRGLILLSRNWRCRDGELDLVVTDGETLIFCEVKTRATAEFGDPSDYVTPEKILRIRRATRAWLRRYPPGSCDVRFDVLAVLWPPDGEPEIRHLRGAF